MKRMEFMTLRRLLPCALALLTFPVAAQSVVDAKAETPAPATTLQFNSTFSGYRAYTDPGWYKHPEGTMAGKGDGHGHGH